MDQHTPVLLHESVEGLHLKEGDTVVDATLGLGGHSALIAEKIGTEGTLVGIDADEHARALAQQRLASTKTTLHFIVGNFRTLDEHLHTLGITDVDAILFDLGWNATQLTAGRGFSFHSEDPLLMTLSATQDDATLTAQKIVATWSEEDLADIIRTLGEERLAGRIARAIVVRRKTKPIEKAHDLAEVIANAVPPWYRNGKTHPATKTFQALRIMVNDELSTLTSGLEKAFRLVRPGGRIAVITFHSLEDGLVKRTFKKLAHEKKALLITKKPIAPQRVEVVENPRARSAKLRIIEKI